MLGNTLKFDQAIGKALEKTNPKETLIIVTADHETGGLAINGYATSQMRGTKILGKSQNFLSKNPII